MELKVVEHIGKILGKIMRDIFQKYDTLTAENLYGWVRKKIRKKITPTRNEQRYHFTEFQW